MLYGINLEKIKGNFKNNQKLFYGPLRQLTRKKKERI